MSLYEEVKQWRVPHATLAACLTEMAPDGKVGNEGIVLWLGTAVAGVAAVQHLVALRGRGIRKTPVQIHIEPDLFNEVSLFAEARQMILVGQIHSHPETYTDLSLTDIRYGVSSPYYLSLVAPFYAQVPVTSWQDCGIHVFEPKKGFRRLRPDEVRNCIVFAEGDIPLTCVGT